MVVGSDSGGGGSGNGCGWGSWWWWAVVRLVMIVTRCNSYYQGTLLAFLGQGITKLLIVSLFTSRIGLNLHICNS